jgi:hypothetical protein
MRIGILCPENVRKLPGKRALGQIWRKVDLGPITNYNALIFGQRLNKKRAHFQGTFSGHIFRAHFPGTFSGHIIPILMLSPLTLYMLNPNKSSTLDPKPYSLNPEPWEPLPVTPKS